jgi:single-stranded-DNA-specific exonuclease
VILIAMEGEEGRGSARSIPEYHLLDGIRACGDHLDRFGGHRQAAGLQIQARAVPAFREAFNQVAREALEGQDLRPSIRVDLDVDLSDMSQELLKYLQYLGPHGIGNPGPSFLARGLGIPSHARVVGTGHLKLRLQQGSAGLDAIGFNLASRVPPASLGRGPVDAVFQLQSNEFRGVRTLQANLKDIRPSGGP